MDIDEEGCDIGGLIRGENGYDPGIGGRAHRRFLVCRCKSDSVLRIETDNASLTVENEEQSSNGYPNVDYGILGKLLERVEELFEFMNHPFTIHLLDPGLHTRNIPASLVTTCNGNSL